MPDKDEKARRKELAHRLRDEARERTRGRFPAPPHVLKYFFDLLNQRLAETDCDDTLRFTRAFIRENALDEEKFLAWLEESGGFCDCETLNNVEDVVADAIPGYDDLTASRS